jgi:hypothetical protein
LKENKYSILFYPFNATCRKLNLDEKAGEEGGPLCWLMFDPEHDGQLLFLLVKLTIFPLLTIPIGKNDILPFTYYSIGKKLFPLESL